MRFIPVEPDIATVFNRITDGDYDLQPNFQRGEVWSVPKQQRLIDSILRGWVVPPILLIKPNDGSFQQVLDGQQRLVAIRDFKRNKYAIDGKIEPRDARMEALHGLFYKNLPSDVLKRFDRTPLRLYEITDYTAEEPAEIFFRLNQPTALTSAEKRNAFFGPVRHQIRRAVERFEEIKDPQGRLGFNNDRMAFDDVFARLACLLEFNRLDRKVTASAVTDMYRRQSPLRSEVEDRIQHAIDGMAAALGASNDSFIGARLNKATLFSWLLFLSRRPTQPAQESSNFFERFEMLRAGSSRIGTAKTPVLAALLLSFNDRSTSRVSDVSSVQIRDFVLWFAWAEMCFASVVDEKLIEQLLDFNAYFYQRSSSEEQSVDSIILDYIQLSNWGSELN